MITQFSLWDKKAIITEDRLRLHNIQGWAMQFGRRHVLGIISKFANYLDKFSHCIISSLHFACTWLANYKASFTRVGVNFSNSELIFRNSQNYICFPKVTQIFFVYTIQCLHQGFLTSKLHDFSWTNHHFFSIWVFT